MKSFLVDVPVKINVWIRPECQKRQFDIIKKARPSVLFIVSDNGRNDKEKEIIAQNRRIVEDIDWECTVYKLYEDENQGLYTMGRKMHELIWSHVDRCIFLEDDILPSVSYFRYCAELLEKYKNDLRVNVICGMNHLGVYEDTESDYFFSRQGAIWGVAMWKRTYEQYSDFSYGKDKYVMKLLEQRTRYNKMFWKRIVAYSKDKMYEGHEAWDEFFLEFSMYGHNQLQIVPRKNMISNIGSDSAAAHSDEIHKLPKGLGKVFGLKTYEIDFPLKHPRYIIPDVNYEKERNKIMAYNYPLRSLWRRFAGVFLKIKYGDWSGIKKIIKRKMDRLRGTEEYEK